MSLYKKRVFVSGGAGVIGNELCPLLFSLGAVVMVGELKPRPLDWDKTIIYRQGDLNFITKEEIENFNPEIFIHLAATFEQSAESYGFWEENFMHNVRLSHHLMGIMKDLPLLNRVVFASSYLIYEPRLYNFEIAQAAPCSLKETDPVYPRNLTGMAKFAHEIELRFLEGFKKDAISFINVRIFRGYGKGSRCIISRWIRSLLNNEEISVYRKEGIFDYIYAEDTAKGLAKLAENTEVKGVLNLGTGKARKVSDVLEILKKHFPEMKYTEADSDIPYEATQADMSLFEKEIGWVPSRTLEDTIPEMIEFEKTNHFEEQKPFNVLVTSISQKIPLLKAVRKACDKFKTDIQLVGGDSNPGCIGKYVVDSFWQMPVTEELSIDVILGFCLKNNIKAIVPTRDGELLFWATIKESLLKHGITVMVSPAEGVEICNDKLLFSQKLIAYKFPAIPSFLSIDNIDSETVVLKERFGAGSKNIALNISKKEAEIKANEFASPLFQPFIKGKEFSVDVYVDKKGTAKGAIARSRDKIVNGESQITTTVSIPALELMCCKAAEMLQLYGHVVFQAIEDENNQFHIIECNCRFGGASTLSIACGLDSFYWFLLEASGVDIDEYPFLRSKEEKRQVRFSEDMVTNCTSK